MSKLLPSMLCNKLPEEATSCAWGKTTTCNPLITRLTKECLVEKSSEISFFILQPEKGREYGALVGTCVDNKLAQFPHPPERESLACLELLNEFHLADGEEQRNFAFLKRLRESESLQAIEEFEKGKIEAIYRKGLKSKRFDLEATEVRIEYRKRLLPTAATEDVVRFGRSQFQNMKSLCDAKGSDGSLKDLVALGEKRDFLKTVTPESAEADQHMKNLGKELESLPKEEREKAHLENEQALAAVIRSGWKQASKAPTQEQYEAKFIYLDTKMTPEQKASVDKDPMSCQSLKILMEKSLETDPETLSILVKFMLSQS